MGLEEIKGMGQTKITALQDAGIDSLEKLASIDLRKNIAVKGMSQQKLKDYKQQARRLLRKQGQSFEKAPYSAHPSRSRTARPSRPAKKKGLLGRLLSGN